MQDRLPPTVTQDQDRGGAGPTRGLGAGAIVAVLAAVGVGAALTSNIGFFQALDAQEAAERILLAAGSLGLAAGVAVGALVAAVSRVEQLLRH